MATPGEITGYITGATGAFVGVFGILANRAGAGLVRRSAVEVRMDKLSEELDGARQERVALMARIAHLEFEADKYLAEKKLTDAKFDAVTEDLWDCQDNIKKITGEALIPRPKS